MANFIFLSIAGGSGTNIPVVANYNALIAAYPPPNTTHLGQFVFVENAQGTWWIPGPVLGTYYPAGLYYCNGTDWKTADVPYQATQVEVDAGTVTDKFVSPETFIQGLANWFTNSKLLSVLGFTPENVVNKSSSFTTSSTTTYPNTKALVDGLATRRSYERATVGDTSVSIASTTRVQATSATLTAPRTFTLPLASSIPAGETLEISDAFGAINGVNTITIQGTGSDLINGATSIVIGAQYGMRRLTSNGVNSWTFDAGVLRASNNLSDVVNVVTARNNLSAAALTTAITGVSVAFAIPQIYNSVASPATGNITDNLSGAIIGVVQKIYHNHTVAPTFPAGWVKLGSGVYTTSTLNIIFAEWVSGTRVEYWIVKGS